jgi:hypothetical protein
LSTGKAADPWVALVDLSSGYTQHEGTVERWTSTTGDAPLFLVEKPQLLLELPTLEAPSFGGPIVVVAHVPRALLVRSRVATDHGELRRDHDVD